MFLLGTWLHIGNTLFLEVQASTADQASTESLLDFESAQNLLYFKTKNYTFLWSMREEEEGKGNIWKQISRTMEIS